jgi:putative acyl-CoA dehydrogenase
VEIEYHDAYALRLGAEGQGVKVIIDIVQHTRLGTLAITIGLMRRALAEVVNHVAGLGGPCGRPAMVVGGCTKS